ncbi:hypothetical protein PSEMO_32510 [Pseudomonas putida]|uniref:Uncharacterized protein n=1 Tax=Pseudomonas putida TaxID=303 RepID=A0A1Q9R3C1_PSEPU|nr:hypothetical protein PSEMO_32510 [Pseudomonas putida]
MNQLPETNALLFVGALALLGIIGWACVEGVLWVAGHVTVGWTR